MQRRNKWLKRVLGLCMTAVLITGNAVPALADESPVGISREIAAEHTDSQDDEISELYETEEETETSASFSEVEDEIDEDETEEETDEDEDDQDTVGDEDYNPEDDGNNPAANTNGIVLSEMFHFPSGSNSLVHPDNDHQAIITQDRTSQQGHMWYKYQLDLDRDFTLESQIYLGEKNWHSSDKDKRGGDGLTFVLHNDPRDITNVTGGLGWALGVGATGNNPVQNGISLEFDTYFNGGSGDRIDAEILKKYNHMVNKSIKATQFPEYHLLHIAVQELPLRANTNYSASVTKTWSNTFAKNQSHGAATLFTNLANSDEGEFLRKDFGDRSSTNNTGNGYTLQVYERTAPSDVFGRWHNLVISWDASSNTFTYEIGGSGSTIHAVESYRVADSKLELDQLFNFNSSEGRKVYWGFTGSTGTYTNFQSVAIKSLPYYVEAEAAKEAKNTSQFPSGDYTSDTLEAEEGDIVSYRSELNVEGQNSQAPFMAARFEDELDGIALTGDIEIEWKNDDGSSKREYTIENAAIINDGDPRDYTTSSEPIAYLVQESSDVQKLYVFGLGNIGETDSVLMRETLRITYQAEILETSRERINNTYAIFSGGSSAALETAGVPIQVIPGEEPVLEAAITADKEEAHTGEEIAYFYKLENNTKKLWNGSISVLSTGNIEIPAPISESIIIDTNSELDLLAAEVNDKAFHIEEITLNPGEYIELTYKNMVLNDEEPLVSTEVNATGSFGRDESTLTVNAQVEILRNKIFKMQVPSMIDFGNHNLGAQKKRYKIENNADILVTDTRGGNTGWTISANILEGLHNEKAGVTYHDAFVYNDGESDTILTPGNTVPIIYGSNNGEEVVNASSDWYSQGNSKGLYVNLEEGRGTIGEYKATILWTLSDVPE